MATNGVSTITATGVGTGQPIVLDRGLFQFGVGLLVTIPATVTAVLYSVQVCGDNPNVGNGLTNWNDHDIMKQLTASANGNLAFPVTGLRLNVISYVGSGTITFNIVMIQKAGGS